jgi:hypothetical protein
VRNGPEDYVFSCNMTCYKPYCFLWFNWIVNSLSATKFSVGFDGIIFRRIYPCHITNIFFLQRNFPFNYTDKLPHCSAIWEELSVKRCFIFYTLLFSQCVQQKSKFKFRS